MEEVKSKTCNKCNKEKLLDCFNRNKTKKDGYSPTCKECENSKYTNTCEYCGVEFKSRNKKSRFCSISCNNKSRSVDRNKVCPICNKNFNYNKTNQICCSKKCAKELLHPSIYVKCDICGKEVKKIQSQLGKGEHFYCSKECKHKGNSLFYRGENNHNWKNRSYIGKCAYCNCEITVKLYLPRKNYYCSQNCKNEHQKELNKGEGNPRYNSVEYNCDFCGKTIYRKKSIFNSREHVFCNKECSYDWQSINNTGENNHNYRHDLTNEEREIGRNFDGYLFWRREVYKRDNYTCQCCGYDKGKTIQAHHLDGYNWAKDKRTDVDNGVALCKECHDNYHNEYGRGNNTKEQFYEWINKVRIKNII